MITVNLHQVKHQIPKESSLQDFINLNKITSNGIAIAVNEQIIPKINWNNTLLKNQDSILIIKATQGG